MRRAFSAAWREAQAIVVGLAALTILALSAGKRGLAWGSALLLGWVVFFFRDPERGPALSSADVILAPADGRVMEVTQEEEPDFLRGPAQRITIFLSLFDVHVQRSPYAGQVELIRYQPGAFAPAFLKDSHKNEANLIGLQTPRGPLLVRQVAGILARRIVCRIGEGQELDRGQRLGLIKFGSRVDLFLPPEAEILVAVGEQVYGGYTVVGRWR